MEQRDAPQSASPIPLDPNGSDVTVDTGSGDDAARNATIAILFAAGTIAMLLCVCCCGLVYLRRARGTLPNDRTLLTASRLHDDGGVITIVVPGAPQASTPTRATIPRETRKAP